MGNRIDDLEKSIAELMAQAVRRIIHYIIAQPSKPTVSSNVGRKQTNKHNHVDSDFYDTLLHF